jgi:hypothetical protein
MSSSSGIGGADGMGGANGKGTNAIGGGCGGGGLCLRVIFLSCFRHLGVVFFFFFCGGVLPTCGW